MKRLGNELYVQRGETFSLDFAVLDAHGRPFVLLNAWKNPYLVITVSNSQYEQIDSSYEAYWLDLANMYVEKADRTLTLTPNKRFTSTEYFKLDAFDAQEAFELYGVDNKGRMVFDKTSEFDVSNFLFYVDAKKNGKYEYKYLDSYSLDENGRVIDQHWTSYSFRVVKHFNTKDWTAQSYFYDIKVLSGQSVQEYVAAILDKEEIVYKPLSEWTDTDWEAYISLIQNEELRSEAFAYYEKGAPLVPNVDVHIPILEPTPIHIGVDIQGGNI